MKIIYFLAFVMLVSCSSRNYIDASNCLAQFNNGKITGVMPIKQVYYDGEELKARLDNNGSSLYKYKSVSPESKITNFYCTSKEKQEKLIKLIK